MASQMEGSVKADGKKIHPHQLWKGAQHSRERGLDVYKGLSGKHPATSYEKSRLQWLDVFRTALVCSGRLPCPAFGQVYFGETWAALVADEGLCPPRGFLISFRSIQQSFYLRACGGPEISEACFVSTNGWVCGKCRAESKEHRRGRKVH